MKNIFLMVVCLNFCFAPLCVQSQNYEFVNGYVFSGKNFVKSNIYSVNRKLTFKKPASIDSVIDVAGKYVIPPFGESHNHNLGEERGLDNQIKMYLSQGVFYSRNLHYLPERTLKILNRVNIPSSVDVAYAHTGLVATGGHTYTLYQNLFKRNVFPEFKTADELDGKAYLIINNHKDLEEKWNTLLQFKPDFVKTYLEYSDEFEKRQDAAYADEKGISPALLKEIVEKAHKAGLRVIVHIESAGDFRNAVNTGVDEIAHLPGFRLSKHKTAGDIKEYSLTDSDAVLAKKKNVAVTTTTAVSVSFHSSNKETLDLIRQNQIDNLKLLRKGGVTLLFGSDMLNATSVAEALYIKEMNVFDNLTLLKILSEDTPRNIFPKRKIGYLKEGYEASFLVLNSNPLEDFNSIKDIAIRFKEGEFVKIK